MLQATADTQYFCSSSRRFANISSVMSEKTMQRKSVRIPDPMQAQIALLHAIRCQCNLTQWPPVGFPIPHRSTAESWRRALLGRFESALWHMRGYLSPRAGCQRFKDDDSLDSGSGLDNKQTVSASLRFCFGKPTVVLHCFWTILPKGFALRMCIEILADASERSQRWGKAFGRLG